MDIYRILLIVLCFIGTHNAFAKMYRWVDENGRVQFSDRPPTHEQSNIEADKKTGSAGKKTDSASKSRSTLTIKKENISDGETYSGSIILKIRRLIQQKKFNALNQILHKYQTDSESDILAEEDLFTAYDAFDIDDESYDALFNAWIEASPESYQPYIARAEYYYSLGWASRGNKWVSETKKEKFVEMANYFGKALEDIATALKINSHSMVPYYLLIGITNTQDKDDEMALIARKALEINPASYKVRSRYLYALTPRWGGSFEQMQAFIDESLVHVSKNPRLSLLEGYIYAEAGEMQALVKKYSLAEELYTKALTYGENHGTLKERGENSYRRENYKDALIDLDRAIEMYPEDGSYYYWRSKTYSKLQQFGKAVADQERAYQLDPDDEYIQSHRKRLASKLTRRGYELRKNRNHAEAVEKYNAALRLAPDDADIYYRRARAFVGQNQLDSALSDLKIAIRLDANDINYYLLLDWVLAKRRDWNQIIRYWDQYIELNPDNSRAYVERGGAYYRNGDIKSAVSNAKFAADMGNLEGKEAYEKFRHKVK